MRTYCSGAPPPLLGHSRCNKLRNGLSVRGRYLCARTCCVRIPPLSEHALRLNHRHLRVTLVIHRTFFQTHGACWSTTATFLSYNIVPVHTCAIMSGLCETCDNAPHRRGKMPDKIVCVPRVESDKGYSFERPYM